VALFELNDFTMVYNTQIDLVSGLCPDWLVPSKVSNRVGVSLPSREHGNKSSFRNVVLQYLEFRTLDNVQELSDSEWLCS
jgi:hypothetical protein